MQHQDPGNAGTAPRPLRFARRMETTPRSFIREILKVTQSPEIISFAGGLPNPDLIDAPGIAAAAEKVLRENGSKALQYATTEGDPDLRRFIADRYKKRLGLTVSPDEVLITNGSQQCLDLIGKVFINPGDRLAIERPGYLGAIQAFSLFEPAFVGVPLLRTGVDTENLRQQQEAGEIPLMYGVPNSQNPSGITYSDTCRRDLAKVLREYGTVFVEDDAYGELTFSGTSHPPVFAALRDHAVLTGSFSKILSPGMRLGWICARGEIMEKIVTAKQASDLHSNVLAQQIAARYLADTSIDDHIRKIRGAYARQCSCMLETIGEELPETVEYTRPEGGMFVWLTLPEGCSSMEVFDAALKKDVAVLPGLPFYVDGGGGDTLRLNFSNAPEARIVTGIRRLGSVITSLA